MNETATPSAVKRASPSAALNGPSETREITTILRLDQAYEGLTGADSLRAFYAERANRQPLLDAICALAEASRPAVISWDVFDTALLREPKAEAVRFWEMSEAFVSAAAKAGLDPEFRPEDAFLARGLAARAAYGMARASDIGRDGRLAEIAEIVCDLLGKPKLAPLYIACELAYERNALAANPLVAAVAASLTETRTVFISDMYLEGERIAGLLMERLGLSRQPLVFSSADGDGTKRGGRIFGHVAEELGLAPGELLHIGDNLGSDFQNAKAAGWRAFLLPLPEGEEAARRASHRRLEADLAARGIRLEQHFAFNF